MIDINLPAPMFSLPVSEDTTVSLSDLAGSPVVLFFYPRDNTSGCTTEAIGFSETLSEFNTLGAKVFGVSKDSLASHVKFTTKKDLTVPLLSDEHSNMCETYGVWKEKKMYGKVFMGIERTTVLIDANGTIIKIWRKVKVAGHVQDVLNTVKAL